MRPRSVAKTLVLSLLVASCAIVVAIQADEPPQAVRRGSRSLPQAATLGVLEEFEGYVNSSASCSSTACHGGARPGVSNVKAARGSELPIWRERDPHARAWRTLCSAESVAMLERLRILEGDKIVNQPGFANCLACHNTDQRSGTDDVSTADAIDAVDQPLREGVSCESCHGASDAWLRRHYASEWQSLSQQVKTEQLGFVNNTDLLKRARLCASCHAGDGQHDMNHDMIAAGHPPLFYELTTFHNRLPKHWRDSRVGDVQRYEASLWLSGQVAAIDAQLALIESRASQSRTWPELSTFDCAACHRPLRSSATDSVVASNQADSIQRKTKWSQWHRWGIESLLSHREQTGQWTNADQQLRQSLAAVSIALQVDANNRAVVIAATHHARQSLQSWLQDPSVAQQIAGFTADHLRQLVQANRVSPATGADSWESLSQLYLASVAARAAWPHTSDESTHPGSLARQLRRQLLFSPNTQRAAFELDATTTQAANQFLKTLQKQSLESATLN